MKKKVAVFDIDGTIFRWSLFLELVERLVEKGILPKNVKELYAKEYEAWLNREGSYEEFIGKAVEAFRSNIQGVPYEEATYIAGEIIEEKRHRVYRYTRDLIEKLKKDNYFLLAISHSPFFITEGFGYEFGFHKTYGFFYETGPTGTFTGEVAEADVIKNKAAVLQRAVRKENRSLEGSVGVGDTESDIPMLEMVETPIAFNPNQKLLEHARKRGWKVVVERKDVIYEL